MSSMNHLHRTRLTLTLKRFFKKKEIAGLAPGQDREPETDNTFQHTDLRLKSKFFPVWDKGNNVDVFIQLVLKDFKELTACSFKHNLTLKEKKRCEFLKNNFDLVVKQTDKGGGVVVMSREYYLKEAHRLLDDNITYKVLANDPTAIYKEELRVLITEGKESGILTAKEFDFLFSEFSVIALFYILPKIHKSLDAPPGRPIISGIDSQTSNLSKYIDFFLQPVVKKTRSYLKDTSHILRDLERINWEAGMMFATIDVTSLYTSIPHQKGVEAIKRALDEDGSLSIDQIEFLLKSILFILEHNFFWFENKFYLQICGPAMGTRFAPSYANLYMHCWECDEIWPKAGMGASLVLWRRFIDDIIIIWKGGQQSLIEFISSLDNNPYNLKFTSNISDSAIDFLHLTIYIKENKIETKTFFKRTDSN
uniref:Reverse transcriptase domain-containing protein n=1 Tax=Leptobrachium leishanense TaxID=445787 RepID=A0A8C5PR15_9ANUR